MFVLSRLAEGGAGREGRGSESEVTLLTQHVGRGRGWSRQRERERGRVTESAVHFAHLTRFKSDLPATPATPPPYALYCALLTAPLL